MAAERYVGKVALVTGAARGIGRATAIRLASEGADVILCDYVRDSPFAPYPGATREDLLETERQVAMVGRRCVSGEVDVRDLDGLQGLVDRGVSELGRLDVVIANAGIASAGRSWEISEAEWDEVVSINLKGVWNTTKATIPTLIEQGQGGVIAATGSTAAVKGLPFLAHYAAAKHGVLGLVKSLAVELGQYDIRVVAIHPAGTRTGIRNPMMHQLMQENPTAASVADRSLPAEHLEPEDIAAAFAFAASDEARYLTGSELRVDLGNLGR